MNEVEANKKAQEMIEYSTWMLEANETAPSPSFITLDGNSVKNFLNSGGLESESDFSPERP